ncbi:MAG TPA: zinc-ribbon domain-containing protein [Anaerolineae bacterium]|nr:zinc-ribbon domain-containing protein [Anaerolineae bacterium]
MKQKLTLLVLALLLFTPSLALAQTEPPTIEQMTIEIWPDFDQPAVLVLITGFFAEGTPNPTEVTLPLPNGANIHVVAVFTEDNVLTDQGVEYTTGDNTVTFSTPGTGFRLEYYVPYETLGNQRSFNYTWLADMPTNELTLMVQEPFAATGLTMNPTAVNVTEEKGLTYHSLPPQPVPAGTPFSVDVTYTMSSPQLTVDSQVPEDTAVINPEPVPPPTTSATSFLDTINWPLALAGAGLLLIIAAVAWQIASSRSRKKRPVKPRRQAAPAKRAKTAAKYCHECGQPLQPGDKFCRECGTAVKK